MDKQPSRKELMQRIAALEAKLQLDQEITCRDIEFSLADFENAADGICVCHAIDAPPFIRFTFWNRKMVDLTGYQVKEINRNGWYQSVYPDPEIQAKAVERMAQMREGVDLEAEEWEITRSDGQNRTLRISTSVMNHGDGIPHVMAVMHDVTELKRAEMSYRKVRQDLERTVARQTSSLAYADQALKACDSRYRALFEIANDALFIENDRDEILDVNQKACDLLGYSREELLSMLVADIQAPECRGESGRVLINENTDHQEKPLETMDLHKDGTRIPVEVTNNRLEEAGLFLSIVRDIRDRKQMEEKQVQLEKLQSLGVLAGGIAHDFNNFLTGIIGNLSLANLETQPGHPVLRALNEMEKAAIRAKELTQQLLTFSKGGAPIKHAANIFDLVRESAQFALRGSNVQYKLDFEDRMRSADIDEGQIAQVLHNLLINADQAMPDGGVIFIRGTNASLSADNPYTLKPGEYIKLSIRDHGVGIPPEHLKRVFDPYFTTKQKGSGLGLAVTYSIVAKHDGQITAESKAGEGTTFTILLPASRSSQITRTEKNDGLHLGSGRILVMDDENIIRDLAAVMLKNLGYHVTLAESGEMAVAIYRDALESDKFFDAVVLDLTVPGGMGGKETVQKLISLDPNVTAIVSSGYSNDPVMADYTKYGFSAAVKKPYQIQDMSRVLHEVVRAKSG